MWPACAWGQLVSITKSVVHGSSLGSSCYFVFHSSDVQLLSPLHEQAPALEKLAMGEERTDLQGLTTWAQLRGKEAKGPQKPGGDPRVGVGVPGRPAWRRCRSWLSGEAGRKEQRGYGLA